jgi:arsenate reductase
MTTEPITLWFNAACSKCRAAAQMLEERGVAFSRREYLLEPPTRAELDALLLALGTSDPRDLMRTGDERFAAAGLQDAGAERLLDALTTEPGLLQRPIAVRGGTAVLARPPERVLELLD